MSLSAKVIWTAFAFVSSFFLPLLARNDVKEMFASARGGDQYRVLKIVIEDGKQFF